MSNKSKIEWTDATWNPVVGCTKCSPGCENCYAEAMSRRIAAIERKRLINHLTPHLAENSIKKYLRVVNSKGRWNNKIYCDESALNKPLHWRKPRRIFPCSMSDLFHPTVPFEFVDEVFRTMVQSPRHTYQILTKRPARMSKWVERYIDNYNWSTNRSKMTGIGNSVWLGVSVSTQAEADEKIPILLQIPAAVRFVSIEPMLEGIEIPYLGKEIDSYFGKAREKEITANQFISGKYPDEFLDWVIVGGESGPKARPMHPYWVRSIRNQCQAASVPFFFKQWGEYYPLFGEEKVATSARPPKAIYVKPGPVCMYRVGKKKAGRLLDGKEYQEYPEK